jgi:hypothetical protein
MRNDVKPEDIDVEELIRWFNSDLEFNAKYSYKQFKQI